MNALDIIFRDKVTVFSRYGQDESLVWIPTVITDVHFVDDKAAVIGSYGESTQDNAMLHVFYKLKGSDIYVGNKKYYPPKEFERLSSHTNAVTFQYGDKFGFVYGGLWTDTQNVYDMDYKHGFYDYMNKNYDRVYAITGVSQRNLIPHFEITAR